LTARILDKKICYSLLVAKTSENYRLKLMGTLSVTACRHISELFSAVIFEKKKKIMVNSATSPYIP